MNDENPYSVTSTPETISTAPLPTSYQTEVTGLGGWLILVGIGVIFSPLRVLLLLGTVFVPIFTNGTYGDLSSPGSEFYNPAVAKLLIFESLTNGLFVLAYIALAFLFFSKSKLFPRAFIGLAIANFLFILLDAGLAKLTMPSVDMLDVDTVKELTRSAIAACIWVPYMLISKRVKTTFVA